MKRMPSRELLDEDLGSPDEIRDTLLDLRDINRNLGGFESMATMLRTVVTLRKLKSPTFLDAAGGAGDVADSVARELLADGIDVESTVLDRAVSHMNGKPHHLEPEEVITFRNEALRGARSAVIASDLRRNVFHWAAAYAGRMTYRSRLTRNDAPASVRQAYTMDEIGEIAKRTHAQSYDVDPYYFQRFGLILWKAHP